MKLIRRLLRYISLLVFVIVLGCAYYYRALIFSEVINTYVDNGINNALVWANIIPEQAEPATEEIQPEPDCKKREDVTQATETDVVTCECEVEITEPQSPDDTGVAQTTEIEPVQAIETETEVETEIETDVGTELEEQTIEVEVEQTTDEEPVQIETEEQVTETDVDEATDEEPVQTQTEDRADIETTLENISGQDDGQNAPKPHFELINQARLLHLTGNTSNAIDLYRELGELYPDDPNVYGELGNVFYLKGEWKQASLAYYQAALRLQKLEMSEQIHYLYLVIHGLDPEIAEKLRVQLES